VTVQGGAIGVNAAGCNTCSFNQMHHELEAGAYLIPASSGANTQVQITKSQFNGNVGVNAGNGYLVDVTAAATNASVLFTGNNFGSPDNVFFGNTAAVTSIGNTGGSTVSGTEWYNSNTITGGLYIPTISTLRTDGTFDASLSAKYLPRQTSQANPNSPQINCVTGEVIFSTTSTAGQNIWNCTATNTWTQNLNSGVGGATVTLNNLTTTAINADLLPSGTRHLGAATTPWADLFIGSASGNTAQLTGTFTGNRVVTFPDSTFTVAGLGLANVFSATNTFNGNVQLGASGRLISGATGAPTSSCIGKTKINFRTRSQIDSPTRSEPWGEPGARS
jgi:hypothetical protein